MQEQKGNWAVVSAALRDVWNLLFAACRWYWRWSIGRGSWWGKSLAFGLPVLILLVLASSMSSGSESSGNQQAITSIPSDPQPPAALVHTPTGTLTVPLRPTETSTPLPPTETPTPRPPTETPVPPIQPRPTQPPPTPAFGTFGSGTKIVGTDIAPGTYRTRQASTGCYWARLSGFGGTLGEIIANENTNGPEVVTIAPTDKGFQSTRCGTWTSNLSPITQSPTSPFGTGTFIVGVDIAPGTWRADGGSSCYWARLSGFGGTLNQIIANDNGTTIVTIAPSDRGFTNTRCGTWTKIQ